VADDDDQQEAHFIIWLEKSLKYAALRLAIKHRKSREKELLILNSPINDDSEEDIIDRVEDKNVDVVGTVCSNIFVEELLSALTEKQRAVIEYTETAVKLGISQQAVNRLKSRALKKIKRVLEEQGLL
jgi:DNA-directed RNA polymerase specialized sigma subunit